MKFGKDIHGHQRINLNDSGDPLNFHLVLPNTSKCSLVQNLNDDECTHVNTLTLERDIMMCSDIANGKTQVGTTRQNLG